MSASNEWTEWCLTSRGWERRNTQTDFKKVASNHLPEDTVSIWKYSEYQQDLSFFSSLEKRCTEIYLLGDREEESRLIKKYGSCPEAL